MRDKTASVLTRHACAWFLASVVGSGTGLSQDTLPGTQALTLAGDLSAQMVAGIGNFLDDQTSKAAARRESYWRRDSSSAPAYERSVQENRSRLRKMIGAVDPRVPFKDLILVSDTTHPAVVSETGNVTIRAVRWPVFEGVHGEGLWLMPKGPVRARVVVVPDADQTPEFLAGIGEHGGVGTPVARQLAERGCEVLVPVLVSRADTFSGNARLSRWTNQPHREWIYRQAYEMGRHIIGYEVQKVLAAVDFFQNVPRARDGRELKIGVAGYCEGGLIALYAAALDTRIQSCLVSGYFGSRQDLWQEPIYRNVFGLLREFGDAEIATLVAPRTLVLEHSPVPGISGPPSPRPGRSGAAPGKLGTPAYATVATEFQRARALLSGGEAALGNWCRLVPDAEGTVGPFSAPAKDAFAAALGLPAGRTPEDQPLVVQVHAMGSTEARQERALRELEAFTQDLQRVSEIARDKFFWSKMNYGSAPDWARAVEPFKRVFREEVMGTFPEPTLTLNPRSRKFLETEHWTGYEVVLDVYPEVFAWGHLLVPAGMQPGERRPVVVCQHGLEGVPADTINTDPKSDGFRFYKAFAARLAERGFVVFSPHNPYRGRDRFRELQRKANPLGASLFSVIIAQHASILKWLGEQSFVDPQRIGFYGLSYGGKTAMRVPAVLEGYCLSICSADFNEWVRKNVSVDAGLSYMYTGEYEMPEWDLGHTFNYAEMAGLIAPRPFMVERGHNDGVGHDEWVAYEFARVRRLYNRLEIPDRTGIEFFNGPHTINGVGTFEFLHKHLRWSAPGNR